MIGFTLWSESLSLEFPTWYTTYLICNTHFHFSNSTEQLSLSQFPSMMEFLPTYLICNNRFSNSTNQLSLSQFPSMMEFLPIYLICNIHFHFSNSTKQLSLFQLYKTTFTFPVLLYHGVPANVPDQRVGLYRTTLTFPVPLNDCVPANVSNLQ